VIGFSEHRKEPSGSVNRFRIDSLKACLGTRAVLSDIGYMMSCDGGIPWKHRQKGWNINRVPVEYGSTVGPPFIIYGMKRGCRLSNVTVGLY
jgi:hypothetical protein